VIVSSGATLLVALLQQSCAVRVKGAACAEQGQPLAGTQLFSAATYEIAPSCSTEPASWWVFC
jgi:hypothetical protein